MEKKVIFLDIDGVLNSAFYDRIRGAEDGNIDPSRMPLLKKIVIETGAEIVLSSSWRRHWEPDGHGEVFCELNGIFKSFGLEITDKTPVLGTRSEEISAWLENHPEVKNYVILDDAFFGWGAHETHLVKTSAFIGKGLTDKHADEAIKILNCSE